MTHNRDNKRYYRKYGLARDPFPAELSDQPPFFTRELERRLERISSLIESSEDTLLVTAPAGGGKTVLAGYLARAEVPDWTICYVSGEMSMGPNTLAQWLLKGAPAEIAFDPNRAIVGLHKLLEYCNRKNIVPVFVIDNAHTFTSETLTFIFQLAELRYNKSLFRFVLFAEESIRDRMNEPEVQELAGDTVRSFHIPTFSAQQTAAYIQFRLETGGGGTESPFSIEDIQYIHRVSAGLPGGINLLARSMMQTPARGGAGRHALSAIAAAAVLAAAVLFVYPRYAGDARNGHAGDSTPEPPAAEPALPAPVEPVAAVLDMDAVIAWLSARPRPGGGQVELTLTASLGHSPEAAAVALPADSTDGSPPQPDSHVADDAPVPPAAEPSAAANVPAAAPEPIASAPEPPDVEPVMRAEQAGIRDADWFLEQPQGSYVVQLLVASKDSTIRNLVRDYPDLRGDLAMYTAPNKDGALRYYVVYGAFADKDAAAEAMRELPAALQSLNPWPRSVSGIVEILDQLH